MWPTAPLGSWWANWAPQWPSTTSCRRRWRWNKRGKTMYYVVTGAAGFIGSNLVRALNERGETDIIAVDNLSRAEKFLNLADCEIADFIDKRDFVVQLSAGEFEGVIEAVLHEGACSDTMETDGRYMMEN